MGPGRIGRSAAAAERVSSSRDDKMARCWRMMAPKVALEASTGALKLVRHLVRTGGAIGGGRGSTVPAGDCLRAGHRVSTSRAFERLAEAADRVQLRHRTGFREKNAAAETEATQTSASGTS